MLHVTRSRQASWYEYHPSTPGLRTAGGRGRGEIYCAYQRASCKVVLCVHRGGCRVRIFFYDTVGRYAVSTKGKNYFTLRFKARVCAPLPSAAHRRDRVGRRGTEGHGSVGQDVLDQISPEYTGASHFLLAPLSLVEQSSCSRCSRCSSAMGKSISRVYTSIYQTFHRCSVFRLLCT